MSEKKTVAVTILQRLGSQVPEFDLSVTISKLDGTPVQLRFRCKALKKTDWAKVKDDHQREAIKAMSEMQVPDEQDAPKAKGKKVADKPKIDEQPAGLEAEIEAILVERGYLATVNKGLRGDAAAVVKFAIGWELEDAFNVQNVAALEDEFGGALRATLEAYDRAIFQGRLGNFEA